ncbi:MAG: VWA domain-containing protein, partial [Cyanobacteria bacterium SZAS LIN-3]|nr:VWA domain-containing protein [Cyanobacteria bacterium SZAS LIN-3]
LRVYGAYAYPLFSGGFGSIGVSTYTLLAEASAGMPALDLVIVDNVSGSMDDQTRITLVRRHWDQTTNDHIIYSRPGTGPGPDNEGTIATVFCSKPIGSQVNGLPPQNLDAGGDPHTANCPKEFSEVGPNGKTVPLRGITNNSGPGDAPPATPPEGGVGLTGLRTGPGYAGTSANPNGGGNFGNTTINPTKSPLAKSTNLAWRSTIKAIGEALVPPAYASWTETGVIDYEAANGYGADNTLFTDMVVNLDGNTHFSGYTDPNLSAYTFPRLDFLVEAARGNMENGNVSPDAWLSNDLNGYCQPGYQQAYEMIAYRNLQPKATIESAICNFMTKVSQTSDCHFGFVAFGDRAGTNPNDTFTAPMVSWAYPVAGNVTCLLPQIPIDSKGTNLQQISALLTPPTTIPTAPTPKMTPNGGCNLADGLKRAVDDLTGPNSRSGAMKAIVVITDKVPTRNLAGDQYPDPTGNGPALRDAMDIAARCNTEGIPIFMVTIDQANGQMSSYMRVQYSDTSPDGLVNKAGHGGALYINPFNDPTTGAPGLNGSFNNVLRQLTTLVQG